MKMHKSGELYVISGPAGAGKGTICKEFLKLNPDVCMSVSYTTREPRQGEIKGISYNFVSKEKFEEMITKDEFLEHAEFCGNHYGTSKKLVQDLLDKGTDVILEIEVQGAMQVKKNFREAVLIFVLPPSMNELKHRIETRGTETREVIEERLKQAYWEKEHILNYDYIVLNDRVENAVKVLEAICIAEKNKVNKRKELIEEVF